MQPTITPLDDDAGLMLYDPIENARFVLYTDGAVEPRPADPSRFAFPVETAVSVETTELVVPKRNAIHVRTLDGRHCDEFDGQTARQYAAADDRLLDVTSTAIKLYLVVPGPFEIVSNPDERNTVISLIDPGEVTVGIRSFHERPAHTIETPAEPEAVMRALSMTGSALKTLSCERSYPTLRGHPPAFEVADELSIPDGVEPPETDVTVWVPPKWEFVYPVAPLVYYLGAKLRPDGPPTIEVGDWTYSLGKPGVDPGRYQKHVLRAMQKVFFMDCLTRTEGYYPIDLHERSALDGTFDFDFATLYDAPLETQIRTFLDVPYGTVEEQLPTWHLCVDVEPTAEHVPSLPYLLDDLALIRCRLPAEPPDPDPELEAALDDFTRGPGPAAVKSSEGDFVRSTSAEFDRSSGDLRSTDRAGDDRRNRRQPTDDVFTPEPAPAMEQAYLGQGLPYRRNKLSLDALRRRLEYDEPTAGSIDVRIVCNDEKMADETTVEEYYGVHDLVQYSVDISYDLTVDELADVLQQDVDLLHYIGHVDDPGFACTDGHLDAHELDGVSVDTFLLNACNSFEQGQALLAGGATGGVTSLTEIGNDAANRLGKTMARALNAGFTLRSAFALTAITSSAVYYIVLGDGGRQLVQCQSGVPYLADLVDADLDDDRVEIDLFAFPASSRGQGTFWSSSLPDQNRKYLTFGYVDRFSPTVGEFKEYLTKQSFPVMADGKLHWSNDLTRERTREALSEIEELRSRNGIPTRITDFFGPLRGDD